MSSPTYLPAGLLPSLALAFFKYPNTNGLCTTAACTVMVAVMTTTTMVGTTPQSWTAVLTR